MNKFAQLFSCLSVVALLAACGDDSSDRAEQTEKAIEEAAKDQGIDLDATLNEDGEIEKIEMESGGSTVGQNLDLPDGFPEDVFISSGWNIMSTSPTPGGFMVQSLTSQDSKSIVDEVREKMTGDGWAITAEAVTPLTQIGFEKDDRMTNFNVIPNGDTNAVQVVTMKKP